MLTYCTVHLLLLFILFVHYICYFCYYRNLCCQKFPQALPKLLQSVTWNNRSDVAQVPNLSINFTDILLNAVL